MNPRQMKEYKHEQQQKRKRLQFEREQAEMRAEYEKAEKAWADYKAVVYMVVKNGGEKQEWERASEEFGVAEMWGGRMVCVIRERENLNGTTTIIANHKYLPRSQVCEKPEYSTTTETTISREGFQQKWRETVRK